MNRREFLSGLASTTALVPLAAIVPFAAKELPYVFGWDFGGPDRGVVAMLQYLEDGRLAVREITGIEFFKGPED